MTGRISGNTMDKVEIVEAGHLCSEAETEEPLLRCAATANQKRVAKSRATSTSGGTP